MIELASRVNDRLNTINLVEIADGKFLIENTIPDWMLWFDQDLKTSKPFVLADVFLFFDTFLDEVRQELKVSHTAVVHSGPWSEPDENGIERHLFASGFLIDDQLVLQMRLIAESRRYHQEVFQKAREYSMAYERQVKEKEQREVLLHTIVHDLAGPLTSIYGVLDLLQEDPSRVDLIDVALSQASAQQQMIQSILDAFSTELTEFDSSSLTIETAPRLRNILIREIEVFEAAFEAQGVRLEFVDNVSTGADLPVVAEADYLERVLSNLLENALRFSPEGTTTEVSLSEAEGQYVIAIIDQGSGVPMELQDHLFERFSGGPQFGGKQGLGLYFCRMAVNRWGQSIWCESPSAQESQTGTRMVFTLEPFPNDNRG